MDINLVFCHDEVHCGVRVPSATFRREGLVYIEYDRIDCCASFEGALASTCASIWKREVVFRHEGRNSKPEGQKQLITGLRILLRHEVKETYYTVYSRTREGERKNGNSISGVWSKNYVVLS